MVALALTAIFGAIAAPRLARLMLTFNRVNARAYLLQDLKRAQAESITQGCRGIVVIAANSKSYTFGCDYLDYDVAANPVYDKVFFVRSLPERITMSTTAPIIFNSRGQAVDIGGIMSNTTMTLTEYIDGQHVDFATGLLLGTGVFSYQ